MGAIGDVTIANSSYPSGAAFLLMNRPRVATTENLGDGWMLQVTPQSRYAIVTCSRELNDSSAVLSVAYERLQRGLDVMSVTGKSSLVVDNANDEYIVWWRLDSQQKLRIVFALDWEMNTRVTLTRMDQNGNIIPDPPPSPVVFHESLRYFRLSQVTDDLFDSFRNMYLALELLLDHNTPKRRNEGEGDWLRRSLAPFRVVLAQIMGTNPVQAVSKFYSEIYSDIRCSLFHAKQGRRRLVPQNPRDREIVGTGLDKLTRLVLHLSQSLLNVSRDNGVITSVGFSSMMDSVMVSPTIFFSDSDAPSRPEEDVSDALYQTAVSTSADLNTSLSVRGSTVFTSSVDTSVLRSLRSLHRFSLSNGQGLICVCQTKDHLRFEDIDNIEVQIGLRLRNSNLPKAVFRL